MARPARKRPLNSSIDYPARSTPRATMRTSTESPRNFRSATSRRGDVTARVPVRSSAITSTAAAAGRTSTTSERLPDRAAPVSIVITLDRGTSSPSTARSPQARGRRRASGCVKSSRAIDRSARRPTGIGRSSARAGTETTSTCATCGARCTSSTSTSSSTATTTPMNASRPRIRRAVTTPRAASANSLSAPVARHRTTSRAFA